MRVIVTRPQQEALKWVNLLAQAGLDAVALPLIGVAPAANAQALLSAWDRIANFDAAMFVSGNAVDYFFASKPAVAPVFSAQAAIKTRAFVTGPGSVAALLRAGADRAFVDAPDADAGQFDSETLWAVIRHRVQPGYRVLIVRGSGSLAPLSEQGQGRDWFARQVLSAGGLVEYVVAYQRQRPQIGVQELALVAQAAVDGSVWLFSSSEAIANLISLCPQQSWGKARAVVTHGRIGAVAQSAGFCVVYESRPRLEEVLASIESLQ